MSDLATVRRELAAAQSDLRRAHDAHNLAKLNAEVGLIERVGEAIGSNESTRKRALDAACEADPAFVNTRETLRDIQETVGKLEAELNILIDARKDRELEIAERNIELVTGVTFKTEAVV